MTQQWESILDDIDKLPPLSDSVNKLLVVTSDKDHSLADVKEIIECDGVLAASILKHVNSAAFGLSSPMDSIERALGLLGDKNVVGIALDECIGGFMNQPLTGYAAGEKALWEHNLKTAIASREISKYSKTQIVNSLAYTSGLLHSIGKIIMSNYMEGTIEKILKHLSDCENPDYLEAERAITGFDHAMIGAELAKKWQLPESITESIRWHHEPSKASDKWRTLVYVTHLGCLLASMGGAGTGVDSFMHPMDGCYKEYIDISKNDLEVIVLSVTMEYNATHKSLFGGEK